MMFWQGRRHMVIYGMWSRAVRRGGTLMRWPTRFVPNAIRALATASGPSPFGVVLDIDGVLAKGKEPIKGARTVMDYLSSSQSDEDPQSRIPYILMTNGGGVLEDVKANEVNDGMFPGLPVPLQVSQVLLSHTPMKALVPQFKDKVVLALGSKDYLHVAKSYGFTKVVSVDDLSHWYPELYPFRTFHKKNHNPYPDEPISAIMVLYDPVDWAVEIQVLCDVVKGGVLASQHLQAKDKAQQVPVFSSNPDFVFSTHFPTPRLAQGAFIIAWDHIYQTCYGGQPLQVTQYGKPTAASYRYAEHMLVHECRRLGVVPAYVAPHNPHKFPLKFPLKTVYAIGDNPASDIQGARKADGHSCRWVSILVRSGVFGGGPNDVHHPADYVVDDVQAALHLILELEDRLP